MHISRSQQGGGGGPCKERIFGLFIQEQRQVSYIWNLIQTRKDYKIAVLSKLFDIFEHVDDLMMSVQRKEKTQNPAPWQIFRQMVTSSLGPFLLLSVLREKLRLVSSLQLLLRGCRQTASFPPM